MKYDFVIKLSREQRGKSCDISQTLNQCEILMGQEQA